MEEQIFGAELLSSIFYYIYIYFFSFEKRKPDVCLWLVDVVTFVRLPFSHLSRSPLKNKRRAAHEIRLESRAGPVQIKRPPPPHRVGCSLLACCCRGLTDSVLV